MSTLSDSTKSTRKFIYILVIVLIIMFFFNTISSYVQSLFSTLQNKQVVATRGYGNLPEIVIPSKYTIANVDKIPFDLQTTTGKLILTDAKSTLYTESPKFVNIYKYFERKPSLYLSNDISTYARNIGFSLLSDENTQNMTFQDDKKFQTLTINKLTRDVTLKTDINKNTNYNTLKAFSTGFEKYESTIVNDLKSKGIYNSNFDKVNKLSYQNTFSEFLKWDETTNKYISAESANRTELLRTNIFKTLTLSNTINDSSNKQNAYISFVRSNIPTNGGISVISGLPGKDGYYFFSASGQQFDSTKSQTYDIISLQDAYIQLQKGNCYFMNIKKITSEEDFNDKVDKVLSFHIKKISLDYYEPFGVAQYYTNPIYVFSGYVELNNNVEAEFEIYVKALKVN